MTDDDALRRWVEDHFVVENTGWAAERVQRVSERLQRDRAPADRLETIVVWLREANAYLCDDRTVYFSRRLLERLPDDDAAAFIIAHELAHQRLGHVHGASLRWSAPRRFAWRLVRELSVPSAERERDADLIAIELCLDAGYDLDRCLEALHHCEHVLFDLGNVDGVVGAEDGVVGSHPPIRARIDAVRAHAAAVRRGERFSIAAAQAVTAFRNYVGLIDATRNVSRLLGYGQSR